MNGAMLSVRLYSADRMIMYSDLTKYGQGRGSSLFTRRTETTEQHKSAQNVLVRLF